MSRHAWSQKEVFAMRRLVMRSVLAAMAAGGATLLILGPTAAAAPAMGSNAIPTTSQAGYVTLGQNFRFVSTTVQVPTAKYASYAEVVLGGHNVTPATLGVKAGGGPGSVGWNVVGPLGGMAGGTMNIAPKVGDWVTLSIYFNQHGRDYFTVTDLTQKVTKTLNLPAPAHVVYTAAEVACVLGNVTAPAADFRLWGFTKSLATTYSGIRGSMVNPMWTTREIIDVQPNGHVVMSPKFLWNEGHNFGAWLHPAS
jgi:hypothetical protein